MGRLIRSSPLTAAQAHAVVASDAFGPLAATLRRAEAHHHDVDALFPRLVAVRGFDDAADIAAVLDARLARATAHPSGSGRTARPALLIAGLVPEAVGRMDADMRQALDERRELIEQRAASLARAAIRDQEPWTRALGTPPRDPQRASAWRRQLQIVAAYRDRYTITGDRPLGVPAESIAQRRDAASAATALALAKRYAIEATPMRPAAPSRGGERPAPRL